MQGIFWELKAVEKELWWVYKINKIKVNLKRQ